MSRPIIGWESSQPVPNGYQFTDYLQAQNGRLHFHGLDLVSFFTSARNPLGVHITNSLELSYLPKIEEKIKMMRRIVGHVQAELGYGGEFHYAYATKANPAEEVIRTTLAAGAHHEMSSSVDVQIALLMIERGLLPADRFIIANGFKAPGSAYSQNLLKLRRHHSKLIPVLEDSAEIGPLADSRYTIDVGLRLKSYSDQPEKIAQGEVDSRFGQTPAELRRTAQQIAQTPNLRLKMLHAMVGGQLTDKEAFVNCLRPAVELYAQLRQQHPTLSIFNFGGGIPVRMTLDFHFDYYGFWRLLLGTLQEICAEFDVPVPDVMGEFGRYTTAEHGLHIFKVTQVKENSSHYPWYLINGSIMTSFPDVWALGDHFTVLPLNHLDKPFQQVKLGGITCDSDDVYPPKKSDTPLFLPEIAEGEELYIAFFSIGAYQDMLGGVRGTKHCLLPEADDLIIDVLPGGQLDFHYIPGQTPDDVLENLGYYQWRPVPLAVPTEIPFVPVLGYG